MEDLWTAFKERYRELDLPTGAFWEDGIFNEVSYRQTHPKILFVLKEVNSQEPRDLRQFLKNGPRYQTWFAVARWAAGLAYDFPSYSEINKNKRLENAFQGVAAINLKKTGGTATSNMSEIAAYAYIARDLLIRQIYEIQPDIILACGVFDILKWLFDLPINPNKVNLPVKETHRGFWIVPIRHPSRANMMGEKYYADLEARVHQNTELVSYLDALRAPSVQELTMAKAREDR